VKCVVTPRQVIRHISEEGRVLMKGDKPNPCAGLVQHTATVLALYSTSTPVLALYSTPPLCWPCAAHQPLCWPCTAHRYCAGLVQHTATVLALYSTSTPVLAMYSTPPLCWPCTAHQPLCWPCTAHRHCAGLVQHTATVQIPQAHEPGAPDASHVPHTCEEGSVGVSYVRENGCGSLKRVVDERGCPARECVCVYMLL